MSPLYPGSNGNIITAITPNPALAEAVIHYYISNPGRMTLTVYDSGGRLVALLAEGEAFPGAWTETINAGELPPGLYFCVLTTPGGRHSVKFAVAGKY